VILFASLVFLAGLKAAILPIRQPRTFPTRRGRTESTRTSLSLRHPRWCLICQSGPQRQQKRL